MNKVFLYLYPIEEYTKMFLFHDDRLYDTWKAKRTLPILDECIQKRYREKGYQVVFALYPDRTVFGITPKEEDRIIFTDITFDEASAVDSEGKIKRDFVPKYPNEQLLLNQLGNVDELVIGGYHFSDCVKRVGAAALAMGIDTMVDIDLTDLFFRLYNQEEYFKIDEYNPQRYKEHCQQEDIKEGISIQTSEKQFQFMYSSPIYKFYPEKDQNFKK